MTKMFDTRSNPVLSSVIDSITGSLQCSKYKNVANRINICLPDGVSFEQHEHSELARNGFSTSLIKSYGFNFWEAFIVIDMGKCTQAALTEREIAAVIFHELGHLLNEPDFQHEPNFEYCLSHRLPFNKELLEEVRTANGIAGEVFADSYAKQQGYGKELISSFDKQNKSSGQQAGYCAARIEKLQGEEYYEGKLMTLDHTES